MQQLFRGALLAVVLFWGSIVQAATITWDISVFGLDGPLSGQTFSGTVSVDDAFVGAGSQILSPSNSDLAILFDFVDEDFTTPRQFNETEDIDFSAFPQLYLTSGVASGMDFLVVGASRDIFRFFDQGLFVYFPFEDIEETASGSYTLTAQSAAPIPEPATLLLVGAGLGVAYRRRRD